MSIRPLPPKLRDLIAAGEVVQRPASVLKELLENAHDAGATALEIRARDGGMLLLEVADDGSGIPVADLQLAVENHATSKIQQVADLDAILTLGFRGEALASVRACADLTVETCCEDEQGWSLVCPAGGRPDLPQPRPRRRGTTVRVENLFGQLPARKKFLKSVRTEQNYLRHVIEHALLLWPETRLRYSHNDKMLIEEAAADRQGRAARWIGTERARHMIVGEQSGPMFSLELYAAQPSVTSSRAERIQFLVNGRPVQDRNLTHGLMHGLSRWIPHGRYPLALVVLEVDPGWLDVNVHPAKTEVRFTDPRLIHDFVAKSVRHLVEQQAGEIVPSPSLAPSQPPAAQRRALADVSETTRPDDPHRMTGDNTYPARDVLYQEKALLALGERSAPLFESNHTSSLRVLGQIMAKYIVAEVEGALWVVDQHAAHEAINYERIRQAVVRGHSGSTQMLLIPETLQLDAEPFARLEAEAQNCRALGYDLYMQEGAVAIRGVPDWVAMDNTLFLADLAEELVLGSREARDGEPLILWAAMRACKASVRANHRLGTVEMTSLIERLRALPEGAACPHGRPTRLLWSEGDLDRMFQRTGH